MTVLDNRMLSVEDALARILEVTGNPLPPEEVALDDTLGRVLAEPVVCTVDLPGWDNSAMDGYAVRSADLAAAAAARPVTLRVVGESRAGKESDIEVEPGTAIRIATGAPLPAGADAVVPVEMTLVDGVPAGRFSPEEPLPEACQVTASVEPGFQVRKRGGDMRAGSVVVKAGTRLAPVHVALAAAAGAPSLRVHRRPVAAVLSTGDELRSPGEPLGAAGIRDSNRPMLLALCRDAGFEVLDLGVGRDSLDDVLGILRPALARADAILVTGGVSVGPYDVVRLAFDSIGEVDLWRIAVQPGKPFAFGLSNPRPEDGNRVLLFGMPGNPVSAFVTFDLFVKPALLHLGGGRDEPWLDRGVLEEPVRKAPGRRAYIRVSALREPGGQMARDAAGRVRLRQSGGQDSHMLTAVAAAEALAIVPETVDGLDAGAEVEVRWLRR